MCLRFLKVLCIALACNFFASASVLRVCADPDSLPSSSRNLQGYENRIAQLIARDLNARLAYEWQRVGRGFVRDTLNKGKCDVVLGLPTNFGSVLTTDPYYRSTYVFVSRRSRHLQLHSFDDPQLQRMKVAVQALGEEYTPPGRALMRRGMAANVVAFSKPSSSAASMVNAVMQGKVDAAVIWGPQAGYYARQYKTQLALTATPPRDTPSLPLEFSISMGVRRNDEALRARLNGVLQRHKAEIRRILRSYGVPLIEKEGEAE